MVITTREMKILETNAVGLGIPLRMLMEAAGKSVADYISSRIGPGEAGKVVVLMGKGGNGGDALVAARYLAGRGYCIEILPAYPLEAVEHPDTLANLEIIRRLPTIVIHKPGRLEVIGSAGVIIDGLLGTGVRGALRGLVRDYVVEANRANAKLKVAIDTPTGLNPDTGEIHGVAFRADATITMHDVKPGLLERREYTGEIVVANIGIPPEASLYVGPGDYIHGVPAKPRDAHKGMGGRVLFIGGSRYYTGAPALAAAAALASGADLAFVAVPEHIRGVVASYTPEIITLPLPEEYLKPQHLELVEKYLDSFRPHVVVAGNGAGSEPETLEFLSRLYDLLLSKHIPVVIDADGLKAIDYGRTRFRWKAIITPHRGEFKALTGVKLSGKPLDDLPALTEASKKLEAVVLLKAPVDVIVYGEKYRLNRTGNPGMTIGGTGDVLAGITGALYARTNDPYTAAAVAAYLNGLAGDYIYYIQEGIPSPTAIIEVLPRITTNTLEYHTQTYLQP